MLELTEIQRIASRFGLDVQRVTDMYDTSHGEDDKRLNYVLDGKYVLKVNSVGAMWEERLQEIRRLIGRYRSIGVYCPDLIPTSEGALSCALTRDEKEYVCFVEEFAKYPVIGDMDHDRKEIVEHLGILASKYTGVDLSETRSMWSIIDLAPLDVDIDEKQENTDILVKALRDRGFTELAERVDGLNNMLRERIKAVFTELPRCVYQGDLNSTNELHKDGHFVGLIDFNMAGTEVNINVFVNETQSFPEEEEFDLRTVPQILAEMEREQEAGLAVILRNYSLNADEEYAMPYYKRISDLFQYPNVCSMVKWLKDESRREKCVSLITALAEKEL